MPPKARLHYVLWDTRPGGAELMVREYINTFGKEWDPYLYSLRDFDNFLCEPAAAQFTRGRQGQLACYSSYFKYCRRHRRDLFHLNNVGPVILLLTLVGGARKVIYHIHGTVYWRTSLQKVVLRAAWQLSSLFDVVYVANSRHSAAVFSQQVLNRKPRIVYNGVNIERFWRYRRVRAELRRIGYVGRLSEGKNVELLIRLFEEAAPLSSDLELHIAGDGALRSELESRARQSAYADRIIFHGFLADVAAFYSQIDLLVFLSSYESFGNVLVEALLTGLPVLTSDLPPFREIFGEEETFILGAADDLARLKENFIVSISRHGEIALRAYELADRVRQAFDLTNHISQIGELYDAISSGSLLSHGSAETGP